MRKIKVPGETAELADDYVGQIVEPMSKYEASFKLMSTYLKPVMQSSDVIGDKDFKKVHGNVENYIMTDIFLLYNIYRSL